MADKSLYLLSLGLIFYPMPVDENISAALREKFYDKNEKLNKYDLATFNDVFSFGCPKITIPVRDQEHFKNFGFG